MMEVVDRQKLLETVAAAAVHQLGGELRLPCKNPVPEPTAWLEITWELESRCLIVKTFPEEPAFETEDGDWGKYM